MRSRILIVLPLMILAAACGGEDKEGAWLDPAASQTATMPEAVTPPDVEAGATVLVTVNDGHIAVPESTIPIGPVVMTVANAGTQLHGLHVEGPGVNAAMENPADANGSGTLSVTFQKGEYTFYCPILDHREKGETLTVTVPTS
jgi:uncharacterized cupredoxin-like copper-binding protein